MNTTSSNTDLGPDFVSIDDPNIKWHDFVLSMLKIGRILLKDAEVRREIRAEQISRLMKKHRNQIPCVYTGKEIRWNFVNHGSYLSGGGLRIESYELSFPYQSAPHFHFTFTKLYPPSEQAQPNQTL